MHRPTALWLLVAVLLTAALLRLPALATSPPGAHFDEAANGVLAGEIAFDGYRPVFIPSYTGKETLFFYTAALVSRAVGQGLFALRLTAALLGLLTIAATYRVGRALRLQRQLAVLAAALLAVTFAHVVLSRLGFRAISQPLLQALAVAFLWEGVRHHSLPRLAAGGVLLGLTAYTYLAARLFPIPLLLALLPLLVDRAWRRRLLQLATAAAAGLVTLTPLLLYFYRNPDRFWVRIDQVAPAAGSSLVDSYLRSLGMFFLQGDPYIRFNLPDRPLLGWFWGGLLIVGWLYLLLRTHRLPPLERSGALLLLLTPWLMILPTALAVGEIVPSNLRAVGLFPFICFLPAIGAELLLRSIGQNRFTFELLRHYTAALVVGALVIGGYLTGSAYYLDWSQRSDLFYENDADLADVAAYIDDLPVGDEPIYVGSLHYQHPTLALLSRRYDGLRWLPQSNALVLPNSGAVRYIFPRSSPAPTWLTTVFSPTETVAGPLGPDGNHTFVAYTLADAGAARAPSAGGDNLGGFVTLREVNAGSGSSGAMLPVDLVWQVNQVPGTPLTPFVHLVDQWGHRWSQAEPFTHPVNQWQPGDTVFQRVDLPIPAGTPPGSYRLRIGFFNPDSGQALGLLDDGGRYAGTAATVDQVLVRAGPRPDPLPRPPIPLDGSVADGLRLIGYAPAAPGVSTGETAVVSLYWLARTPQPDHIIRFELLRPDNTGRILLSTEPVRGTYPFSAWETPQLLIDRHAIPIPATLDSGTYQLLLRVLSPQGRSLYDTRLGQLNVTATERRFDAPPVALGLEATFSDEIRLRGYTLAPRAEAGQYDLQLVWEALAPPAGDYTVFVHLLSADGVCCVWQADVMPRQNSYPTSRWLAGEFVTDDYVIVFPPDAPAGLYPLEIGLFIAESGHRLQATITATGAVTDALFLAPIRFAP